MFFEAAVKMVVLKGLNNTAVLKRALRVVRYSWYVGKEHFSNPTAMQFERLMQA
jgi:hypothetical protein